MQGPMGHAARLPIACVEGWSQEARWRGVRLRDLLLSPAVHLAGRALRRLPDGWRWPLQAGLVVSGVLALASVPVLYGVGRATQPGNASVLPGDYPRALAGVLGLVWAGVLALAASRRLRARRRRRVSI
jgi:hypothetical protein